VECVAIDADRDDMADSHRVILLAYYFPPDNTSGVQRAVRIAKYLPHFGFQTDVVTSSHAGIDAGRPGAFYAPTGDSHAPEYQQVLARIAQRVAPYNERIEWVPHAVHGARALLSQGPVQAVISTSPPLAAHMAAFALKKRFGMKWIADFRDPLYGNPGRSRRWAAPYDRHLERLIFSAADHVVAVTDTVAEDWTRRYPNLQHKFQVVWNGFDPEDALRPIALPQRGHRELAHVGVLYSQRHPYRLVAALHRLVKGDSIDPRSIRLRFVGPIQERDRFEADPASAALLKQGCMEISDNLIPRADANRLIASSDFLLLIDIVNLSKSGYTVPAKLYDYILTGRPILALTDANSPVDRILARSGVPFACLYHADPDEEIDRKLLEFLRHSPDPVAPSAWFLEKFDGRNQAYAFARLIGVPGSVESNSSTAFSPAEKTRL